MSNDQTITPLELEAALCVWEYLNEQTVADRLPYANPQLVQLRHDIGTAELRSASLAIGRYCLAVYDLIPADIRDGLAYDWEIIPAIVDTIPFDLDPLPTQSPADAAPIVIKTLSAERPGDPASDPATPTNASRAQRARTAFRAYTKTRGEAFELSVETIADLITDLLHLSACITGPLDAPGTALHLAKLHYEAERAE